MRAEAGRGESRWGCAGRAGPPAGGEILGLRSWSRPSRRRSRPACRCAATCRTCCRRRRCRCAICTRWKRAPRCSGRSSSRSNRTTPARRAAAARLVRDRLAALPAGAVIGVSADSAAKDRFAWDHRHLLAPTADLTGDARRAGGAQGAAQSAVRVAGRRRGRRGAGRRRRWAIACVTLQGQLDAAKAGAEHPAPLVSKDGRLQIVVVRTRFPAGEVSRNAPVLRGGRARGRRGARARAAPACASASPATSSPPRRSIGRCWAACCARPCSRS